MDPTLAAQSFLAISLYVRMHQRLQCSDRSPYLAHFIENGLCPASFREQELSQVHLVGHVVVVVVVVRVRKPLPLLVAQ